MATAPPIGFRIFSQYSVASEKNDLQSILVFLEIKRHLIKVLCENVICNQCNTNNNIFHGRRLVLLKSVPFMLCYTLTIFFLSFGFNYFGPSIAKPSMIFR